MSGRCDARPELPDQRRSLEIRLPALPCRGGEGLAERLFTPLGWSVAATAIPLDPAVPAWGDSRYVDLRLTGVLRLADALNHLYVLLPVLDDAKHYWVSSEEVDKLIRAGEGWLGEHPDRELITARYLLHQRTLVRTAVGRLAEIDDTEPEALDNAVPGDAGPQALENVVPGDAEQPRRPVRPVRLVDSRHEAVIGVLRAAGAAGSSTLAAARGRCCGRSPPTRPSARSSERTSHPGHWSSRPGGWNACQTGSGTGSGWCSRR